MRKFFWKLSYMRQMMKRSKCGLQFAWESACACEDWGMDMPGAEAADEEMSNWDE